MNRSKLLNVLMVSAGLSLLQPLSAFAGTITITDLTDNASISFSADLIARGVTGSCTGEVCTALVVAPAGAGSGGGLFGEGQNYAHHNLLESGGSTISDLLGLNPVFDPASGTFIYHLTFTSDSETSLGSPVVNDILETGLAQQIGYIDWATGGPATTIVDAIVAQSDIDAPTRVPEPISLSLFGAGLVGAVAMRRRKKKAA